MLLLLQCQGMLPRKVVVRSKTARYMLDGPTSVHAGMMSMYMRSSQLETPASAPSPILCSLAGDSFTHLRCVWRC